MTAIQIRVREVRESLGLDLAEVARRADVRPEHLARFERGERDMSAARLGRVLDALGLEVGPPPPCDDAAA